MKPEMNTFPGWMKAALAAVLLALLAGSTWFYKAQEQEQRRQVEGQLQAIARLKADQIADWRKGRLDEGADLTERPFLSARLARWLANPQAGDTDILAEFRVLQRHGDYSDVLLVDPEGRVRLSLSGLTEIHQAAEQALALALRDRKPMLTDLHAEAHVQTPHIGVVAPLFAGNGQTQQPLGAVVLVSDASQFLYPLIQSWPVPSQTAETLLVRRDGDDVLFLSDLRHQQDTALKLRIPLSRTDVPAVMAVLGKEVAVEGKDYRGVEVMSVILPIADSPWFMVAKVDAAEAFAVWRFSSVLILALLLGLVALAGAAGLVVWQRNQKAHYRALFQSEAALRASVERHSITLKAIGDAVIATDAQGRVELLNSVAEALTGWNNEEARGQPLEQVFCIVNEETRDNVENPVARVLREGLVVGLANHSLLIARDGTERPIADSGAPIRDEQGNITGVVLVFRDQTEERRAEEALRESEARLADLAEQKKMILDALPQLISFVDADLIYRFVNRSYEKFFECKVEDVVGRSLPEVIGPAVWELAEHHVRRALAGEVVEYDEVFKYPNKEPRHMMGYLIPHRGATGSVDGYFGILNDITRLFAMQEALRRSEENFRHSLDHSPMGVRIVTEEGETIYANRAILDIYGYDSVEDLKTTPVAKRYTPESHADFLIRREKRQQGVDVPSEYTINIIRKDGEVRHLQVCRKEVLWDGEIQYQVIYQDITERKQAKEALWESEEKYRNLFENANEAIFVAQGGKVVFLNPMTAMITGYSVEELTEKPFMEFIHPDDRDMVIDRHVRRIKGEELPHLYSFRIIHRDGHVRWVELNTVLINWKGKAATLNFLSDITERRQMENNLRESEEIMRYIIKHDPNAIAVYNRNLQYIAVSNRYLQDYDVKESDIIGRHHYEVFPEMPQRWKDVHLRCLAGAIERNDDDYFERPDGSITYNRWECRPWHRSDGEIGGIITYTEVTTERKKVEEELRTSRLQLRALATRLQQIREEERIIVAREIHDEMGGGLTGLKMDLSWLLRKMGDADPGEARDALMDRIHTSNALIDQMIHVVRRISTDLRPSVLDDLGLIAALEWQLSEFTSRTEISHEFATTFEYVKIEEDTAVAVFRIFQEALTNVMRHSRATKIAVVLREGERSLFGDERLVLEIRDNGRGITEEEILNLDSLGLLGMKERVLAFGGEFSIRGEPGGGTALVLQIPRAQGEPS